MRRFFDGFNLGLGRCRRYFGQDAVQLVVVLAVIATLVSATGCLLRLDYLIFDLGQKLRWHTVQEDVLIVAIDQDSLDRIGRWPWPREIHSKLLSVICSEHPSAIGFDIAFAEESTQKSSDQKLAKAMADCANVVLPLLIERSSAAGSILETPPIPVLLAAAAGLGRVGVRIDEDGLARSIDLQEGVGQIAWPLWTQELLRIAHPGAPGTKSSLPLLTTPTTGQLVAQESRRIDFFGPPGTMPQISYAQVLEGSYPRGLFNGKIILIGATAVGLGDTLSTPASGLAQPMSGVEIQANILLNLRYGRLITAVNPFLVHGLSALLALVPLLFLPRLMPLPALLANMLWVFTLVLTFAALPVYTQIWFGPSGAVIAGLSAFPLWSWRRLESARRHLDRELLQLWECLPIEGNTVLHAKSGEPMGFEQRIAWVQEAQFTMKMLESQRNDALAFISHDLRVPLSSAIQVLEASDSSYGVQLLPSLRRALIMAQEFLMLSKAESLTAQKFQELDLIAILQQAADELYPLSQQRGIRINNHLPDDSFWFQGDFYSLERVAINLLHNAVTHGPAGSDIGLFFERNTTGIIFTVENEGSPFSPFQMERLFQRFSRGEESMARRESTGLGLYFVRIVIEKHGGRVDVVFAPGKVRFRVHLPLTI